MKLFATVVCTAQTFVYSPFNSPFTSQVMRKTLLVFTSLAAVSLAGCASSANNPWATPDSKPLPRAQQEPAPAPVPAPAYQEEFYEEDYNYADAPDPVAEGQGFEESTAESTDLLAEFPAIRAENMAKALRSLDVASAVEELPMPDKGNARITRYNEEVGVIEFITPSVYAVGDRVVLTKENKAALVSVIAVDGNRIVADLVAGVKGAPVLKPADHVLCDIYRTPEELQRIAEEQRKAQQEAILAARAAAQAEREALAEAEGGDDEEASEEDEESSEDEEASEDEESSDEEEEW